MEGLTPMNLILSAFWGTLGGCAIGVGLRGLLALMDVPMMPQTRQDATRAEEALPLGDGKPRPCPGRYRRDPAHWEHGPHARRAKRVN